MNKQVITYDFRKKNVKCYELHTTMCQIDENFISTLNRIWTNNQTEDDLAYINRNCLWLAPNDSTFPYFFYKNKDVAIHNKKMLSIFPGDEIVINAIHWWGRGQPCQWSLPSAYSFISFTNHYKVKYVNWNLCWKLWFPRWSC